MTVSIERIMNIFRFWSTVLRFFDLAGGNSTLNRNSGDSIARQFQIHSYLSLEADPMPAIEDESRNLYVMPENLKTLTSSLKTIVTETIA